MGVLKLTKEYVTSRVEAYKQRYSNPLTKLDHQAHERELEVYRKAVQKLDNGKHDLGPIGKFIFGFFQTSGILPNIKDFESIENRIKENPDNKGCSPEHTAKLTNEARKRETAFNRFNMLSSLAMGFGPTLAAFTQGGFFEGCLALGKSIASPIIAQKVLGSALTLLGLGEVGTVFQIILQNFGFSWILSLLDKLTQPLQSLAERLDGHAPSSYPFGQGLTAAAQNSV